MLKMKKLFPENIKEGKLFQHISFGNNVKQAGTVLGQGQLKLELELYFTSFKICCIKLVKLVKLG